MVNARIAQLNQETIDQIAAGEVVERPASVVKELVENAIDANADAITVEIQDGGTSYIRVTDNGCGILKEQLGLAFLRHATSKIHAAEELRTVQTLGFRGEALSSISAVSHVEMITKPAGQLMGCRYVMEGSREISTEDVGAPDGTTVMVYHLFYNTPARKKFLKSDATEGAYVAGLMEQLALSHPNISFCFLSNKKERLHTAGNGDLMDTIYQIYGRGLASNLLYVEEETPLLQIHGFLGNSSIARGNRSMESFFINGRYVKSPLLSRALEEGYHGYLMQHQYPFCVLHMTTLEASLDVNVHPAKQEVRFDDEIQIAKIFTQLVRERLSHHEDIAVVEAPDAPISTAAEKKADDFVTPAAEKDMSAAASFEQETIMIPPAPFVEAFETAKLQKMKEEITKAIHKDSPYEKQYQKMVSERQGKEEDSSQSFDQTSFLSPEAASRHRIIGQLFDTYWLVEYQQSLYIIDQHAAHEKVLYEKTMAALKQKEMTSQQISPPLVVTLSAAEQQTLDECRAAFEELGYEISPFGGNDFSITAVPGNLFSIDAKQMFMEMLDSCKGAGGTKNRQLILEKVASMSCKAAVKGNDTLSLLEMQHLLKELFALENPYHCPHGRPTIIAMTKQELEKKFKRIV